MLNEIYLLKDVQYQGGKLVSVDSEGNLIEDVMTFVINSLKQSIAFVIKAKPEVKIEGLWLSEQIDEFIHCIRQALIIWQLFQTITPQMCLHLIY